MSTKTQTDQLAEAWWKHFKGRLLNVKEIIFFAIHGGDNTADLREVLSEIAPSVDYSGIYSPHKLGHWLAKSENQRASRYRFRNCGMRTSSTGRYWQLLPIEVGDAEDILPSETFANSL